MTSALDAPLPPGDDPWAVLRAATRARVALGRAGDALPTARELEFRAAHAAARDAVHQPLGADRLRPALGDFLEGTRPRPTARPTCSASTSADGSPSARRCRARTPTWRWWSPTGSRRGRCTSTPPGW
jgi:hypothetical protein